MIFAIDVGNTRTHWALFEGSEIIKSGAIPTSYLRKVPSLILKPVQGFRNKVFDIGVIGVVPDITRFIVSKLKKTHFPANIFWFGKNSKIPIKTVYKENQIGIDRLCSSFAGWCIFKRSVIVINLGTAITIDAVDSNGVHIGGVIMPGFEIMKKGLERGTAKIKNIKFTNKINPFGTYTSQCVSSGILFAVLSGISEVVSRQRQLLGINTPVIISGGDVGLVPEGHLEMQKKIENISLYGIMFSINKSLGKP
jgi:type III pantothenate kinase